MFKKEIIWRELLDQTIKNRQFKITQQDLAHKFDFSLSTIFHALKVPRETGAIEVGKKGIMVRDIEKFLMLWASARQFDCDIIYQTNADASVSDIEKMMPNNIIWTAYSAFRLLYSNESLPASYDQVYIYADQEALVEVKKRFPEKSKNPNIFVLKPDECLKNYGPIAPLPQVVVDLWNLKEWYAKEFYQVLLNKILEQ